MLGMQHNSRDFRNTDVYHMNEGSGAIIGDSRNQHHLPIVNGAWVSGRYSDAIHFVGDGYAIVADHADFTITTGKGFTAAAWIKSTQDAGEWGGIMAHGLDDSFWYMTVGDTKLYCLLKNDSAVQIDVASADVVNDDKWHHVVLVRENDGITIKIYVDGVLEADQETLSGTINAAQPFGIGLAYPSNTSSFQFEGTIEEARFSNQYGATAGEVTRMYRQGRNSKGL